MALTKMGNFTFLHANQIDALYTVYTSTQIKAFFDSQATELKTYLNNTLTAEVDAGLAGLANYVPVTRTVNTKPLSSDIVLTASDVGLGNVTNESKATMFTDPVFTGNVTGVSQEWTKSLSTTWDGTEAPYTQSITVTGILPTDEPIITPIYSAIFATAVNERSAWNNITKAETSNNTITFSCFESKPTTALNILIKVVR